MNQRLIIIIYILLVTWKISAQDTLQINFNPEYQLIGGQGYGFMKLINNYNNEFEYDHAKYEFKFPSNFNVKDTAIAFNYFTGWKNSIIENTTVFLFGNYKSLKPIVYVDYNHNLDFSDDGLPLIFNLDSTLTVYLKNSETPNALFPIKFFYPRLQSQKKKQIELISKTMGPESKDNNIVSIDFWLADKRMNYKVSDIWLRKEPIKIGLFDHNCNGLFNDYSADRILIGDYDKNYISGQLEKGAIIYRNNTLLSLANETYEVIEIEPTGKYIKLIKSNNIYNAPIGIGDNISDLKIELISGETVNLDKFLEGNNLLLLDFWGSWCKGCTQQLPELKKLAKNSSKLVVLGLNYGDEKEKIKSYLSRHDIKWVNGIANDEMTEKLRIDSFPNYLLIDKNGNILLINGTFEDICKYL